MDTAPSNNEASSGTSALDDGLAIFRYEDDDLFSLDDEKYAAAVYRRIDAEYTDEYNQSQMAEIVRQDNERRNAMARLDMILDETNWRFRCAENEAAKAIAKMTANVEVTGAARLHRAASRERSERGRP